MDGAESRPRREEDGREPGTQRHEHRRGENGNIEAPLWTVLTDREHIVRWAIRSRRNYTAAVPRLSREYPHLIVVRLRSQLEVEEWLSGPLAGAYAPDSHREPLACPADC